MPQELSDNVRARLATRMDRIDESPINVLHSVLRQFWSLLDTEPLLRGLVEDLGLRHPEMIEAARHIAGHKRRPDIAQEAIWTEGQWASLGYSMTRIVLAPVENQVDAITIGRVFGTTTISVAEPEMCKRQFVEYFIRPLYHYLDDHLGDERAILFALRRYKFKCEHFLKDDLSGRFQSDTRRGETNLKNHLYEYLHDQGVELSIEPLSASGRADFVAVLGHDAPAVADAKVFGPRSRKGYLLTAFRQVYRYTRDLNETFGYLIVFNVGDKNLHFSLSNQAYGFPAATFNHKTIFAISVDAGPGRPKASDTKPSQRIEITENELRKFIPAE